MGLLRALFAIVLYLQCCSLGERWPSNILDNFTRKRADKQKDRQTDRQTDRQAGRQVGRQTDRGTVEQSDNHTPNGWWTYVHSSVCKTGQVH
jgi:hypothetical protein